MPKIQKITYWTLLTLLSIGFIAAAIPKITGDPMSVTGFTQVHLPIWFMYVVGYAELVCAICLWFKRVSFFAACGLWIILAGAVVTTALFATISTITIPMVYAIILGIIVWLEKKRNSTSPISPNI